MRKISSYRTRHLPIFSFTMWKRFFICKVVCISFHWNSETLCQDIISGNRIIFSSFNVKLIGIIADCLSKIRIGFQPHCRISYFIDRIQLIPKNRSMWCFIFTFKNFHQFHFDCIAAPITNGTFRTDGDNKIIIVLSTTLLFRSTLFQSTYDIFPYITRKPFVDSCYLDTQSL